MPVRSCDSFSVTTAGPDHHSRSRSQRSPYGLSAAVRPHENLAVGNVLILASALGSLAVVWTALQVSLLLVVVWWPARERRPFHSSLGVLCLVTTVVAGWSALNVRGPMRDYLVFWMSAVGVANVTVLAAAAACWAASALRHAAS